MAGRAVHEVQSSSLKQRVTGPNERRQSNGEISSLEALAEGVSRQFHVGHRLPIPTTAHRNVRSERL